MVHTKKHQKPMDLHSVDLAPGIAWPAAPEVHSADPLGRIDIIQGPEDRGLVDGRTAAL